MCVCVCVCVSCQIECHLKGGSVHAVWRQVEGQDVDDHEERAGDQEVDHVQHGPSLNDHLDKENDRTNAPHTLSVNIRHIFNTHFCVCFISNWSH